MIIRRLNIAFLLLLLYSCGNSDVQESTSPADINTTPIISYALRKAYPHDTASFTEGLLIHDGKLFESTGSPGELPQTRSLVGEVDLSRGRIKEKVELDKQKYFGEGIVFFKGKLYQLTYQSKVGIVYDAASFKKLGEFTFPSREGWGMTTDGENLIMSDGTNSLTYIDPSSFQVVKRINVNDENGAVQMLNELEYIKGYIYANVYTTNNLVKIDPSSGNVVGKLDLTSLANEAKVKYPASLELNGIAYDSTTRSVYVTGKMWPNIYEISFQH